MLLHVLFGIVIIVWLFLDIIGMVGPVGEKRRREARKGREMALC